MAETAVGATIVIHLPSHRRVSLRSEENTREAEAEYDGNIGAYIEFLQAEAEKAGFIVTTDQRDVEPPFSIDELNHDDKIAAHEWLRSMPDLWNWVP